MGSINPNKVFFTQVEREVKFWSETNYFPDVSKMPIALRVTLNHLVRMVCDRMWHCRIPLDSDVKMVEDYINSVYPTIFKYAPELWIPLSAYMYARLALIHKLEKPNDEEVKKEPEVKQEPPVKKEENPCDNIVADKEDSDVEVVEVIHHNRVVEHEEISDDDSGDDDSEDEVEPKRPGPPFIYVIPHKHPRI